MKIVLLAALAVFAATGCRSSKSEGNVEISAETRALWKAQRAAHKKEREKEQKQALEDWRQRTLELDRSQRATQQAESELEKFRERTDTADPIAEAHGSRVYQFGDRFYAQQVINEEIRTEVVANSWKQDNDELVFWGNALGRIGKIGTSTVTESSEIRLLPTGKYKVVSKPGSGHVVGSRLMIPIESN